MLDHQCSRRATRVRCANSRDRYLPEEMIFRRSALCSILKMIISCSAYNLNVHKLEATSESGLFYSLEFAPHTGQSSQLFLDANRRSAQFLPAVARSALNLPFTQNCEHWLISTEEVHRVTVMAHSGQSSELVNLLDDLFVQIRRLIVCF